MKFWARRVVPFLFKWRPLRFKWLVIEMLEWSTKPQFFCLQHSLRTLFTSGTLHARASSSDLLMRPDIDIIAEEFRVFGSNWKYRMQRYSWGNCTAVNFFKIEVFKMPFPAFPGLKLVNREAILRGLKNAHKKWNIWFGNYNYRFGIVSFLVDSKTNSDRKERTNFRWQMVYRL